MWRVAEDEVAGFGQGERELDRLDVAHLTDEQDVGVLSKGRPQRPFEGWAVDTDLSLIDGRKVVLVDVLDRVLQRQDVQGPRVVDPIDDRCQGGRLAGSGRAGDEHESAGEPGHPFGDRRQTELVEVGIRRESFGGPMPYHPAGEGAPTKAGPVEPREREVDVQVRFENGSLVRTQHAVDNAADVCARQNGRSLEGLQTTVNANAGSGTVREQQVGSLVVPQNLQPGSRSRSPVSPLGAPSGYRAVGQTPCPQIRSARPDAAGHFGCFEVASLAVQRGTTVGAGVVHDRHWWRRPESARSPGCPTE